MEQKIKIGVMWSAQGPTIEQDDSNIKAQKLWWWIAELDCILVTWACPWLPNEAAIWAKKKWGFILWISPAFSAEEHKTTYKSPYSAYDVILYTWKWLMERDVTNIRASDAIILAWGWVWTLNEFTIALDEWKVIWVFEWTWWISDNIPRIMEICWRKMEDRIIIDSDPKRLVERVILAVKQMKHPVSWDDARLNGLKDDKWQIKK